MKKGKVAWKIISSAVLLFVFFVMFILIRSANWFMNNFHEVELSTAVYQLFSPLKGTETGVLDDYINQCFYPSAAFSVIGIIIYILCDMIAGNLGLEVNLRIIAKDFCFKIGASRWMKAVKIIALWTVVVIMLVMVVDRSVAVGLPAYVESISVVSRIFEDEYVDPDTVSITFPDQKRNLIVIYLESMETTYASESVGGGKQYNYIPELTELAEENVFFSDDDDLGGAGRASGSGWTMGGLFASATGVPYKLPVDGNSAGDYKSIVPGLKGLGDVLEENGYRNYFMCGSEAVFGGRKDFYEQHGNYSIMDYNTAKRDNIIPEDYHVYWGMEDEKLYEYARQELPDIAQYEEPFCFMMLTVDTHPGDGYICSLCNDDYPKQYENVLACASRQADQFVSWVKEQEWYENTTIILMGDHLSMKADFWDDINDYQRKIYNCFLNLPQGVMCEYTRNRDFTVMDMFPTILAAIGADIEGERLALGVNLFSDQKTLPEIMGSKEFNRELDLYSNYYYKNFIIGENK